MSIPFHCTIQAKPYGTVMIAVITYMLKLTLLLPLPTEHGPYVTCE